MGFIIVALFVAVVVGAWVAWASLAEAAESDQPVKIRDKYYILKEVRYNPETEEFDEGANRSDTDITI